MEYKFMAFLIKILTMFLLFILLSPAFISANGGDQRVVEGKYFINLARSPFTPRVNEKISMLISFVDLQKNKLISEDLMVKIRIARLSDIGGAKEFLFERGGIKVSGGILEFPYTFTDTGLHEIFIDFVLASNIKKIYEAPDFLMDIQEQKAPIQNPWPINIGMGFAGMIIGLLLSKIKTIKRF